MNITPEQIAHYLYFTAWLKEIDREPETVEHIGIAREIIEIEPVDGWRMHKQTDNFTAQLIFKSGEVLSREGKFSDGTMRYVGESDE